jgi:prophage tail gpP-like protein
MKDEVIVAVKSARMDRFVNFTITSDLFAPEGNFSFDADPRYDVSVGDLCSIFVNRKIVLAGIVDTVKRSLSKQGPSLSFEGRSVASILTDSCVTKFSTLPTKIDALAERLVRPLPFIGKKDFVYNGAKKESVSRKFVEISPGDTVFEVIKRAANSQGYLFWASPDGKFVFDKPLVRGKADYKIHALEDGSEMDYIEGSVERTINGVHSEVKVVGESQDGDDIKYVMATAKNGDMPFAKPLVVNWNENDGPAKRTAELQVAVEKASSTRLEYTLKGFSQNGKVWQINKFVDVRDDYNGVEDAYLVKSVTFTLDRQSGMRTKLELQPGGSL